MWFMRSCWLYLWIVCVIEGKVKSPAPSADGETVGRSKSLPAEVNGYNPVCPSGCSTCSAYNGCVTCHKRHFLYLQWHGMRQIGSCQSSCPDGYYAKRRREHGKCLKCVIPLCEACSNGTTCSRCSHPYLLAKGRCVEKCPAALPHMSASRECLSKVNCEVDSWSVWGSCTRKGATCGYKYGLQMRSRDILQQPSDNGMMCPSTVQYRKCPMKHRLCEDVETNESDLSKISHKIKVQKKKLQRLLVKHRKRKLRNEKIKKSNKNRKENPSEDDIITQQTSETNVSLSE